MFWNARVTILSQAEDRSLITIYTDIKALIQKKTIKLDRSIAENTIKEVLMVRIEGNKDLVRNGNIVRYVDDFGLTHELKTSDPKFVKAVHFKNLILLQCDLT